MSAIDWLNQSLQAPAGTEVGARGIEIAPVEVAPLAPPSSDAAGLLSPDVTGLPRTLWAGSSGSDIERLIERQGLDGPAASRDLLLLVLLAEATPPSGVEDGAFLLARADKLYAMGALEAASALLEKAPLTDSRVFQRWFDVSLLLGAPAAACEILLASPGIRVPDPQRIFCLARAGDWAAAKLSLTTAEALGQIAPESGRLLAEFLDDELVGDEAPPDIPMRDLTPLNYSLFEAVGAPVPTEGLSVAFAHADLGPNNGWKARISAAERLARARAIPPARLFELYFLGKPAASGGVWDRAEHAAALHRALQSRNAKQISSALEAAWPAFAAVDLEVQFAEYFSPSLLDIALVGDARCVALKARLLTEDYEAAALDPKTNAAGSNDFLLSVATGQSQTARTSTRTEAAVKNARFDNTLPPRIEMLISTDRIGEAILEANLLVLSGFAGDLEDLTFGLSALHRLGLEDMARRLSLQALILDRRG